MTENTEKGSILVQVVQRDRDEGAGIEVRRGEGEVGPEVGQTREKGRDLKLIDFRRRQGGKERLLEGKEEKKLSERTESKEQE
jgi:hypothetical protein